MRLSLVGQDVSKHGNLVSRKLVLLEPWKHADGELLGTEDQHR